MQKREKILLVIVIIFLVLSVAASFYRFIVLGNYIIEAQVDCDPSLESCFVYACNEEGGECTGEPENDIWYYKYAYRIAKHTKECDPTDKNCDPFTCFENEQDCRQVTCSEIELANYGLDVQCSIPEIYNEAQIEIEEKTADSL